MNFLLSRAGPPVALLISVSSANGQVLSIDPGTVSLDPGSVQTFDLYVSNAGSSINVSGVQLNIQIDIPAGQSATRPKITGVNLFSAGTAFENESQANLIGGKVNDFKWEIGTIADGTGSDPALAGNAVTKVAQITFDTTGVQPGQWNLLLSTAAGPTTYLDFITADSIPMTLGSGNLTVVPEANGAMLAGAALAIFGVAYRRYR